MESAAQSSSNKPRTSVTDAAPNDPVLLGAVLALTALVYAATVRFEFVYDDVYQIVRNTFVHSWQYLPGYFAGKQWQTLFPNASANYYRPMNFVWLRLNHAVFGLQPAGWHATAVLLHLIATCLAYLIARRLTGQPIVAALTALLFGIHPTRHEVVAWVSGTTESLWAVFFLLAFFTYLKSTEKNRTPWMALSCVCYAAALLSKETAIVLPLVIFAHAWLYRPQAEPGAARESQAKAFWRAAGLASVYGAVAVAYIAVRIAVLHGFEHPQAQVSFGTWLLTVPSVGLFYVKQWLLPIQLGEFYVLPLQTHFNAAHVFLPSAILLALGGALWVWRKSLGSRDVAFALVWLIVPLLPVLDFAVLPEGQLVHDRYLYLPGFGAALLCGLALSKLASGAGAPVFGVSRRLLIPTTAIVILFCYSTANAASYWMDESILFQHSYELAPTNGVARMNYAITLARKTDYIGAMKILDGVLSEQPNNWLANYDLGRVFYDMGMLQPAEIRFELVKRLYPPMPDTYLQLGLIDMKTNRLDEAEANLRQAVALLPGEPSFRFSLGVALESEKKCDQARTEFARTLAIDPSFVKAKEQMDKCGSADATPASGAKPDAASVSAVQAGSSGIHSGEPLE